MENQTEEQILVVNTVLENLEHWDAAIAAHVESITGEYLYDANQKVPGGVDFLSADIAFKESVPEVAREKIQELVERNLFQEMAESTELAAYRGGVVVKKSANLSVDDRDALRVKVFEHLVGNPKATEISLMKNARQYDQNIPKVFSGEVQSILPDNSCPGSIIVGIKGDRTAHHNGYGLTLDADRVHKVIPGVRLGDTVQVRFGKENDLDVRNLSHEHRLNQDLGR